MRSTFLPSRLLDIKRTTLSRPTPLNKDKTALQARKVNSCGVCCLLTPRLLSNQTSRRRLCRRSIFRPEILKSEFLLLMTAANTTTNRRTVPVLLSNLNSSLKFYSRLNRQLPCSLTAGHELPRYERSGETPPRLPARYLPIKADRPSATPS